MHKEEIVRPISETLVRLQQNTVPWYVGPYFILTLALLFGTFAYPIASDLFGGGLLRFSITAMLLAGLYAVANHPWTFRVLLVAVVPVMLSNWFLDPYDTNILVDRLASLAINLFLFTVMIVVFVDVVRSQRVSADTIFGAVAVYLLFGVTMALMFQFVNNVEPGSVISSVGEATSLSERHDQFSEFLYFSFVTLTSVGYGDLTPIGAQARSLAMLEGVIGQLYLAILIARLVGIHIAQE